jgi:hypothetical protein
MTQAVLVGGLFIGVLSALPIVNIANCCCLWIVGGGALTAYLAQQDDPRGLSLMTGAQLGFRAGVFGAVIWLVTSAAVDVLVAPLQQRAADLMLRNATDIPPDVRTWIEGIGSSTSMSGRLPAVCRRAVRVAWRAAWRGSVREGRSASAPVSAGVC